MTSVTRRIEFHLLYPPQGPIDSIVQTPHTQGSPGEAGHGTCAAEPTRRTSGLRDRGKRRAPSATTGACLPMIRSARGGVSNKSGPEAALHQALS